MIENKNARSFQCPLPSDPRICVGQRCAWWNAEMTQRHTEIRYSVSGTNPVDHDDLLETGYSVKSVEELSPNRLRVWYEKKPQPSGKGECAILSLARDASDL